MPARKKTRKTNLRVRLYRQGLGDCILITLPKADGSPFHFLIDCGVIIGTPQDQKKMREVVADIVEVTGGTLDLLAVTHEHWDHVSGFIQADDLFAKAGEPRAAGKLHVQQVWFAWTEDPNNPLARRLRAERAEAIQALQMASARFRAAAAGMGLAASATADGIDNVLSFFGAGQISTPQALEAVRSFVDTKPRYCHPGQPPVTLPNVPGIRIYVLGPPENEQQIKKTSSSTELYKELGFGIDAGWLGAALSGDSASDTMMPFDRAYSLPLAQAKLPQKSSPGALQQFFDRYYFGKDTESAHQDQGWRRIDADWLGAAAEFALKLDNATNNTSLVLAIEIAATGQVLLFPGDAQVGNWLSWHDVSWQLDDGTKINGPSLLERTVFYKTGHHGSHNATLKAKGLELMTSDDLIAFIPVDHEVAVKRGWTRMPLSTLVDALAERTKGRLLRSDAAFDAAAAEEAIRESFVARLKETKLFFDLDFGPVA